MLSIYSIIVDLLFGWMGAGLSSVLDLNVVVMLLTST
jgi:hypothetical protein